MREMYTNSKMRYCYTSTRMAYLKQKQIQKKQNKEISENTMYW